MKANRSSSAQPLPFEQWVEQTYPKKSAKREFLRMIGALDVAYLMYRSKLYEQAETQVADPEVSQPTRTMPSMPLKVEEHGKEMAKKSPKAKKTAAKKEEKKPEVSIKFKKNMEEQLVAAPKKPARKAPTKKPTVTMEFEHKPEPIVAPVREPEPIATEPEPLVLETEKIVEETPKKKTHSGSWLDDEALEDSDLRKLSDPLSANGTPVSFDIQDNQGEEETVITVSGTSWRAMMVSPALNLSSMAQIVRVSYGELYILGRMALGAMSGEGYIDADEALRIIKTLADAKGSMVECAVAYHDKDATSKKRATHSVTIRFERA